MIRKSKKGGFAYVKQLTDPISGCDDKKTYNLMGGNASQGRIATYAYYTPDWYDVGEKRPFAVDATVGINEYQFGRTTPDNKFVVASGLVGNDTGLLMTGGKKKMSKSPTKKSTRKPTKKLTKKIVKKSVSKKITPKKTPSNKTTPNTQKDENFLKSVRKLFGMNSTTKKPSNNKSSTKPKTTTKPKTKKSPAKKSSTKKTSTKKTTKPKRSSKRLTKK